MYHQETNCVRSIAAPFLSFEILDEELLSSIASYLTFESLFNLLEVLPRLLVCHGMKAVWNSMVNRTPYWELLRCTFVRLNWRQIRAYDLFFMACEQGRYRIDSHQVHTFYKTYKNQDDYRSCRRKTLWNDRARDVMCFCFWET